MAESIELSLDGQKYVLKADEAIEDLRGAAQMVNEQISFVRAKMKVVSPHTSALLAALNLALKLEKSTQEVERFKNKAAQELEELIELIRDEVDQQPPTLQLWKDEHAQA